MRRVCARRATAPRTLLLLLLLGSIAAQANAQAAAPAPAAEANVPPAGEVEEIIVTISKRDESIQKIPAAVSAFEGETIYGRIIVGPEFTAGMPVGITPYQPRTYGLRVGYAWGSE